MSEIFYSEPTFSYSPEEIKEKDEKEMEDALKAIEEIEKAGLVPFPLFWHDNEDNPVELTAYVHPSFTPSCSEGFFEKNRMDYNIYVPSYKRPHAPTLKMVQRYGATNWYVCIDPSQFEEYRKHYPLERIVIRDIRFRDRDKMQTISSIPTPRSMSGHPGVVNFLLAFSKSMGERRYWTMDDDITKIALKSYKGEDRFEPSKHGPYNKDDFYRCSNVDPSYGFDFHEFMHSIERVQQKSRNASMIGIEKFGISFTLPVKFLLGTRVYTYYLTDNATQVDHMAQHNSDITTSLEMSKHGFVNMVFEGFMYDSLPTQVPGGATDLYKTTGTYEKSKILVRAQPNYSKISYRYSRIHHVTDFSSYRDLRLVPQAVEYSDFEEK